MWSRPMMYITEARGGILRVLAAGRPVQRRDILARMEVDKMPGYPFTKLLEGGLIERPSRGVYVITAAGQEALADR